MITATPEPDFPALTAALQQKAKALGEARATAERVAVSDAPERRWRKPELIWPLFVKG